MRCLERNKSTFYYCLYKSTEMQTDEYGNETSAPKVLYEDPVMMRANVSPATGFTTAAQFGYLENYDKVIVTDDMDCPITESTVLFVEKEPEYRADLPLYDYVVRRVSKSLNSISIAIRKVSVS